MTPEKKLESANIYLRPILLSDVSNDYIRWLNDAEVVKYLEVRHFCQNYESIKGFVESKINTDDEYLMAICCKNTDLHIGNIKLGPIDQYHKRADLSLFIGNKNFWGKGLAVEAIKLITTFAFETLKLNKIMASCYQENQASAHVFCQAGYHIEGTSPDYMLLNGIPHDLVWLGLSNNQYQRRA